MRRSCHYVYIFSTLLALVLFQSGSLSAQQSSFGPSSGNGAPEALRPSPAPVSFVSAPQETSHLHRFWDNKNRALFAATAAFSTADFFVTRANLQSGGRELNPVTRLFGSSTPGLAVNFSLEAGSIIGASYILHRTGHHKL